MMYEVENIKPSPFVKELVSMTFPDYKGRTFRVVRHETVMLSDLNWSGGTRSWYAAVNLSTGQTGKLVMNLAPWDPRNPEGTRLPIPPDMVVVERTHFCGKDLGVRFHVNPAAGRILDALAPKALPS